MLLLDNKTKQTDNALYYVDKLWIAMLFKTLIHNYSSIYSCNKSWALIVGSILLF